MSYWNVRWCYSLKAAINTLRPRRNGRYFADDIFNCIFLNENAWFSLKILLMFVPKVWIDNIPALFQIMAWRRPGDKPLSEPMMVNLLTHICVTPPQWVEMKISPQHFQWIFLCANVLIQSGTTFINPPLLITRIAKFFAECIVEAQAACCVPIKGVSY